MPLIYDLKKLEDAMYNFNKATGVSITLYNTDGVAVTARGIGSGEYCALIATAEAGRRSCKKSNKELIEKCRTTKRTARHICGAGLVDIAIPMLHNEEIVGYLMIGQIKQSDRLPELVDSLDIAPCELQKRYDGLPLFDEEKINSIINIGTMLTEYIMLENMVSSRKTRSAERLAAYIDEHISERLTVESISKNTHISQSGIYKCMREGFGATLGEYICNKRLWLSQRLLESGELTVGEVAERIGFSDPAYFSRCFKKAYGVPPIKYRKQSKSK